MERILIGSVDSRQPMEELYSSAAFTTYKLPKCKNGAVETNCGRIPEDELKGHHALRHTLPPR